MPDLQSLIDQLAASGAWIVVLQILLIIVATLIALGFTRITVNAALDRLFAREAAEGTAQDVPRLEVERRRRTLEGLVYRAVRVLILIIAFLMTLQVLRLDIGPAIAGIGIVGLALSLGAQHLVRDYVAGAFVLIENQYSKGDIVAIAGVTGTVEDVSLRRTTLRDFDGTVHYVPHGLIQTASNLTRKWAGIDLEVPVPYEQDLDAVSAAVDAAAERLAAEPGLDGAVIEKPRVLRIEQLAEQGLVVKVFGKVTPANRFQAAGALRRLIVEECARRGVVIGWRSVPASADSGEPVKKTRAADGKPEGPALIQADSDPTA
ncbi:MAG: mechanosensitive ion channel family protein [Chloroflexota bacterium]